jgi:manganese transport protein
MREKTSNSLEEVHKTVDITKKKTLLGKLFAFMGPAYIVSVGYMDPGNWATDIAGGAQFGYALIWVLLMSNLMALLLQSLSARLGLVAGLDLAQANRMSYSKGVNFFLYILAELAIIATDLAEVLGMAIGLNLLFGIDLIWGVTITALDTFLIFFLIGKGMRKMEAFIIGLIFIIGASFLVEMFLAKPDINEIMEGFIPSIPNETALYIAIGIIGATVMPHNLYLHSALVQTRKFGKDEKSLKQAIKFNFFDSVIALNLAFFVNAAILILAASTFYRTGNFHISEIEEAYKFLEPLLGTKLAPILFAVALIAAGQSSTLTGTLAGQIVMEGYLNIRISPWMRRLITRLLAIIPAILVIIIMGKDYIGNLLIFSQVILSLQLGFAIIPLIHFVSNKKYMRKFAISLPTKLLSWLVVSIIVGLNIKLVISEVTNWMQNDISPLLLYGVVFPLLLSVFILLIYTILNPILNKVKLKPLKVHKDLELNILQPKLYKRIGLAIDFSGLENKIIQTALSLGTKETTYYLIHIVESATARLWDETTEDAETIQDIKMLEKVKQFFEEKGYKAEIKIGYGKPSQTIAKIAKEEEFDLLIVGSHGHKWFKDIVYGATIDKLRHLIDIPVFIVN